MPLAAVMQDDSLLTSSDTAATCFGLGFLAAVLVAVVSCCRSCRTVPSQYTCINRSMFVGVLTVC